MRIGLTCDLHSGFPDGDNFQILGNFYQELADENLDVLLIAGDIISHHQIQWGPALNHLRSYLPEVKIGVVFGNHDYWGTKKDFNKHMRKAKQLLTEHDINYLPTEPMSFDDDKVRVYGVGGWYGCGHPPSNDEHYMPRQMGNYGLHDYMFLNERWTLDTIPKLNREYYTIVVTHFEPGYNPMSGPFDWLDEFTNRCHLLVTGHTHKEKDIWYNDMHIINPGSGYNDPRYVVVDYKVER